MHPRPISESANGVIQEHYDLLRLVVDYGAYPVIVVDQAGLVQMTNPSADKFFGRPPEEMVGRAFPYPVDGPYIPQTRTIQAEDGSWTAEMHIERTSLHGRRLIIVSLRDLKDRSLIGDLIEEANLIDDVTGLLNRRGFNVLTEQQLRVANRTGRGLILLLVDIDDMTYINEEHGRPVGDIALRQAGTLVQQTFRNSDIVGRLENDLFAVTAVEAHRDSGGILVARLRDGFWEFNTTSTEGYQLSVSTGLSRYDPERPCTLKELLARAREVLAEHKRAKGRFRPNEDQHASA